MTDQELLDTLDALENRIKNGYSHKPYMEAMFAVVDVYRRTSRQGMTEGERSRLIEAAIARHTQEPQP